MTRLLLRPRVALYACVLLVTAALVVPAAAQDAGQSSAASSPRVTADSSVVAQINAVRRQHGLRALTVAKGLKRAALVHARSMAQQGFFSHSSANGTGPVQRIRSFYSGSSVGEAILWRSPTVSPGEAVEMWLGSPSHRAILLSSSFREVGIAVVHVHSATGPYGGRPVTIVVADFGARRG